MPAVRHGVGPRKSGNCMNSFAAGGYITSNFLNSTFRKLLLFFYIFCNVYCDDVVIF